MPKETSQLLQSAQDKRQQKFWKRFYLYRRQWNSGENEYEYESTSIEITDWIINCGSLSWQLDTEALNIWKDSNVAITVKNKNDEWNINNKDGIFYNKIANDSKIQIKVGNILSDGSEELIYVYTGIIKDINRNYENQTATIYLLGWSDILDRYGAENLSDNQVVGENLGTGDGYTIDFFTDNKGIGKIKTVYLDGVSQEIPTDYDISQLNDKNNYAKITFISAPSEGVIVTADYIYWYQNKAAEYLVKKLLESTGITSADYEVQNVVFDNLVLVHQIWDTEAEFVACQTKQELEVLEEGSVRQVISEWIEDTTADFEDGETKDNIDTANDEIKLLNKEEVLDQKCDGTNPYGTGSITYNKDLAQSFKPAKVGSLTKIKMYVRRIGSPETYGGQFIVHLKNDSNNSPGSTITSLYIPQAQISLNVFELVTVDFEDQVLDIDDLYWIFLAQAGNTSNYFEWYIANGNNPYARGDAWDSAEGIITGWDFNFETYEECYTTGHYTSHQEILITDYNPFGKFYENHLSEHTYIFKVRRMISPGSSWSDWIVVTNESDINLTPGIRVQYDIVLTSFNGANPIVYNIAIEYINQGFSDAHCKLMTQNIDCGIGLQAFDLFKRWYQLNSKWLYFYTQSSANGTNWEAEKEINGNGQIISTCIPGVTKYLRGIVYFKTDNASMRPLLQKIKLNWRTSGIEIGLANFLGMTIRGAIESLAEMPDYEIGFSATGKFFFREKPVDTNIDYILNKENIIEFLDVEDGVIKVKNYIEATFGNYSKIMSTRLEGETRPDSIDKYGEKRLIISGGNLLSADNIDIATGIAMRYYGFYSSNQSLTDFNYPKPRMRCRVKTKFIPQIDLGDTISLTYSIYKEEKYAQKFNGYCFDDFIFGTSSLAFSEKLMKVIGINLNMEEWQMELELQEI